MKSLQIERVSIKIEFDYGFSLSHHDDPPDERQTG